MFLSKLTVNIHSRTFRRDYANVHDMHRTLMSAYPELPPTTVARQTHGILWRLDSHRGGFTQYVQSHTEPDWTKLPDGHLTTPAETRPLQPVLDAVAAGRKFAFRLVANPTKCDGKTRRRIPFRQPADQIDWLIRQGERHGFAIPAAARGLPDIATTPITKITGQKNQTTKITVEPVRFDGHLLVTDPAAFTAALTNGIGRAKAYGCGLISLAPARTAG
ncbi:type I-E CRISPR-associated protein Cas6/Cse3/CasE [Amycolatopsis acidicola]|uniref:Type I-E CRISPR-associated protein Cas6/Cse3/CasE n=1 Tax=Amycolatopsis acidicola TaxID=2596893 RepID=A0A5N0UX39_9PSEU|nr:type I-E CRISPR-associated protein Cas6/Cse3/CasE [Amycolatopsis acidicola]KAA9157938.1 type I-E CRISPR-associated protein Cas6/Cse3/CasE [Amycolatopsis acidicola]